MMQETGKADLRQLEGVMRGDVVERKEMATAVHVRNNPGKDSATALQLFLDRIPISSIPGIKNSSVVEVKTGDNVKDAIELLYTKNVFGAPIAHVLDPDTTVGRFFDRYIGFIDFATMVLWSLEISEQAGVPTDGGASEETGKSSVMSWLEQNPDIGHTKVGELAKSFLWNPFFPIRLEDTLFHVLLLLAKHRVQVLPAMEQSGLRAIGFVTQNAVIQLLLQSDGLAWFDSIAEKSLSEFWFENEEKVSCVYGDESIARALHILFKSQIGAIAVIDRQTQRLVGSVRSSDVYLLMENDNLFHNRKVVTVEEFIHMETSNPDSDPTIEREIGAHLSAGVLHLRNTFLPRMDSPVINKKSDTLKQAMKNVAETISNCSFLVDELQRPVGVLTLRDIILQFAPPSVDSNIHGAGFFESALEQTGCQVKDGTIVCDH
ncbi:SNF1-related protein kinase regulatory subunit gamma-1-like [Herrania umbratica]|uniref:SNF1-related protein kinase regulatory subunit gamma-1-like n=1 Tax=Herrania umbratica TaxID=108875 RepID=A0A6J1AGA3_9ROSI|nr:SNF1-related protein kinase regulatory subunit gamma-1-like [Herrania umbratica]